MDTVQASDRKGRVMSLLAPSGETPPLAGRAVFLVGYFSEGELRLFYLYDEMLYND